MSEQEKSTRRFVVDTNVFVAAIKPFTKPAQQSHSDTKTLALLIKLINDEKIGLFANFRLIEEYREGSVNSSVVTYLKIFWQQSIS